MDAEGANWSSLGYIPQFPAENNTMRSAWYQPLILIRVAGCKQTGLKWMNGFDARPDSSCFSLFSQPWSANDLSRVQTGIKNDKDNDIDFETRAVAHTGGHVFGGGIELCIHQI